MKTELTVKQQRFIDCYNGNIKEAAQKSGLSYRYCRKLVAKRNILSAIRTRQDTEIRPRQIADRQERQKFWTKVMNDPKKSMNDRLRASELLGKSEADFTDRIDHSVVQRPCGVLVVGGSFKTAAEFQEAAAKQQAELWAKHHRGKNESR
jgi:hypothetical protein